MTDLLPARHSVIVKMEEEARTRDIPIVGPAVATLLSVLAGSIGARRVFELGSAIGYSTAFFAGAVGPGGRVFYTDGSEKNAREARGYLERLGLADRVEMHVGEAVELLEAASGNFDLVFIDTDARRRGFERRRVALLVNVDEDQVEVPGSGFEKFGRFSYMHLDPVREPETLEISPRLPRVLLAAVRVEDSPPRPDGSGEERGRIADGRAQLEASPRADGPRQHRKQGGDGGTHDRNVAGSRLFFHFDDHGMTGGKKVGHVAI